MVSEGFRQVRRGRFAPRAMLGHQLVTVSVLYYLPDHPSLLNEFLWQTMDLGPRYPRIGAFLDFWRREIEATIKEVMISEAAPFREHKLSSANGLFLLN
jgi:uncharacterized protein Usg